MVILVVFFLAAAILISTLTNINRKNSLGRYKAKKIMTENELEFFRRLVDALPEYFIFPQVAMSALLEAYGSTEKQTHINRLKIAQQRIDYVVCDGKCQVIAVIELDDKTHIPSKDKIRDDRLMQAGIRTIRFQSNRKPTKNEIRNNVSPDTIDKYVEVLKEKTK